MMMSLSALVLTAVLAAATPAAAQGAADLIVKLRDPASLETADARDAAAARLSQETGLPLRAIGLTSGGELMLGIDHEALAERLTAAARALPGVVSAEDFARPHGRPRDRGGGRAAGAGRDRRSAGGGHGHPCQRPDQGQCRGRRGIAGTARGPGDAAAAGAARGGLCPAQFRRRHQSAARPDDQKAALSRAPGATRSRERGAGQARRTVAVCSTGKLTELAMKQPSCAFACRASACARSPAAIVTCGASVTSTKRILRSLNAILPLA